MKRRTEITIEIDRVTVISRTSAPQRSRCESCHQEVSMLTACEAGALLGASTLVIHRLAEAGQLHSSVTPGGALVICPNSLNTFTGAKEAGGQLGRLLAPRVED